MLSKEEKCIEALSYLFNHAHHCINCDIVNICCADCEKDNTIECHIAYGRLANLIEEYFDNSPLKFEELHEGMWVWDNNDNKYNKIIEINNDKIGFYYITNSPTRFTCTFEENRFYRKQVEDDV